MDYSRYLVLYSGGADSTHFIESEPTARHLIHYRGVNQYQLKIAVSNANQLNRYLQIADVGQHPSRDGETNEIHALYDTEMALNAAITAAHYGMAGIVLCFTSDDIGIDTESLQKIMQRVEPEFQILTPLRGMSDKKVRAALKKSKLPFVSCMVSEKCGHCAKCQKHARLSGKQT